MVVTAQEQKKRRARRLIILMMVGANGGVWCAACDSGDCVIVRALDRVEELLPNKEIDAPIGRVVVEMRRFLRLSGEGVDRARRRVLLCGSIGIGSRVGNLAAWRLLHRESRRVGISAELFDNVFDGVGAGWIG